MWLLFFGLLWAGIALLLTVFITVDARNAFDGDPETATLSGYIKAWRRQREGRSLLLAATISSLVLIPVYLLAHLVLELV